MLIRNLKSDLDDTDFGDEDEEVVERRENSGPPRPKWVPPTMDDMPAKVEPPADDSLSTLRPADDPTPPPAAPRKPRPVVIRQTRGSTPEPPAPAVSPPAPVPTPKAKAKPKRKRNSLMARAQRPVSAKEALAAAQAKAKAKAEASAPPPPADIVQMACASLGEVNLRKIHILEDRKRLAERWLAHRARGVVRADFALAVTAEVIMDAAARVPRGRLFGVELEHEGRLYAAIIDANRVVLLAFLEGPSVYLGNS